MRRLGALSLGLVLALGGCSGAVPAASPAAGLATAPAETPGDSTATTAGAWHGTVSFRAVANIVKDGPSPDDPKMTIHEETRADVTDVFTVGGPDPDDIADFGTSLVDFTGSVANHGTTVERYVYTSDKVNALGCHYTYEVGTDVTGSWSQDAAAAGKIRFVEDGSYTIDMVAGGDPVTGESVPTPQLPKKLWETVTILSGAARDCPVGLGPQTATEGPVILWASSLQGAYTTIGGKFTATGAGAVVDGSFTFKSDVAEATVTVTWHLVHDGPIVLPHG